MQAVGGLPLVLTTRPNSLRLAVEKGLAEHGLQPNVRFEANILPLMTDLVSAGLGYTVLPACGVRSLLKQGQIIASPITGLFITWLLRGHRTVRSAWRLNDLRRFRGNRLEAGPGGYMASHVVRDGLWHNWRRRSEIALNEFCSFSCPNNFVQLNERLSM